MASTSSASTSTSSYSPYSLLSSSIPTLSRKSLGEIFSNFIDILNLNTELLSRLEERLSGRNRGNSVIGRDRNGKRPISNVEIVSNPSSNSNSPTLNSENQATFPTNFPTDSSSSPNPEPNSNSTSPLPWDPATDLIGDILVPIAPFLKMYSLYVKNFSSALARIESERKSNGSFDKFLKDTERSTWGKSNQDGFGFGLGFQAHLLTIVQRIPRYKLLVGDLLKATPESHRDRKDLEKGFEMIDGGEFMSVVRSIKF